MGWCNTSRHTSSIGVQSPKFTWGLATFLAIRVDQQSIRQPSRRTFRFALWHFCLGSLMDFLLFYWLCEVANQKFLTEPLVPQPGAHRLGRCEAWLARQKMWREYLFCCLLRWTSYYSLSPANNVSAYLVPRAIQRLGTCQVQLRCNGMSDT